MIQHEDGRTLTDEEAQEAIQKQIERFGRFILHCPAKPFIGQIQQWAGLPFRCARYVTRTQTVTEFENSQDIWGPGVDCPEGDYYFEVEVAD